MAGRRKLPCVCVLFYQAITCGKKGRKDDAEQQAVKGSGGIGCDPALAEQEDGKAAGHHGNGHKGDSQQIQPENIKGCLFCRNRFSNPIAGRAHYLDDHGTPHRFHGLPFIPAAESAKQSDGDEGGGRDVEDFAGQFPGFLAGIPGGLNAFEKVVGGHFEKVAHKDDFFQIGHTLSAFPFGNSLSGNTDPISQLLLGHPLCFSQVLDSLCHTHCRRSFLCLDQLYQICPLHGYHARVAM